MQRARAGEGTTLIEVITYRRLGHAQHDNQSYQPADEIERWATSNDPLDRYVAALFENGWATEEELEELDARVDRELDAAVAEAEASPLPDPLAALDDVYTEGPVNLPWTRYPQPDPTRA